MSSFNPPIYPKLLGKSMLPIVQRSVISFNLHNNADETTAPPSTHAMSSFNPPIYPQLLGRSMLPIDQTSVVPSNLDKKKMHQQRKGNNEIKIGNNF
jgi:hypothetical protein